MTIVQQQTIYEMSLNLQIGWQAHSLSNRGSDGTNETYPREQALADGTKVDAISGSILKHEHADVLAQYHMAAGMPLCPACAVKSSQRVALLFERGDYTDTLIDDILQSCAMCDTHGFLVTAKNAGQNSQARQRMNKSSIVEFTYGLALPGQHSQTTQPHTRAGQADGTGQMLMIKYARSGQYALGIRYTPALVGVDSDTWQVMIDDEAERGRRHRSVLEALRDLMLSPSGALTATMLPHLTGLYGAVVVKSSAGRAPMYSALEADFVERLAGIEINDCQMIQFKTVDEFSKIMFNLIKTSLPALPRPRLEVA